MRKGGGEVLSYYMTLIIHKMFRKTRQGNTTQQKDKARQHDTTERRGKATQHNRKTKQHNTTRLKQLFFKEKLAASGGTQTTTIRFLGDALLSHVCTGKQEEKTL